MSEKLHQHKAYTHTEFMIILCYIYIYTYIFFSYTWLPTQVSGCHLFVNDANIIFMSFLPAWGSQHSRLEVTADHRVVNVTPEGAHRQVAEWWPKKSCFIIETQDPQQLIALFYFDPRRRIKCCQRQPPGSVSVCFARLHFEAC